MSQTKRLIDEATARLLQLGRLLTGKETDAANKAKQQLTPKVRTDEEIKAEYTRVVCELGHRVFSHQQEERAIAQLHQRCVMLQAEGRAAQEAAAKAKAPGLKAVPDEAAEVQAS